MCAGDETLQVHKLKTVRTLAVVVTIMVVIAAACSSEPSPPLPLTSVDLITGLRGAGFEFEPPESSDDNSFSQMYGFTESFENAVSTSDDKIWTYEFIGPAEALIAATRVSPDGSHYNAPVDNDGHWLSQTIYGSGRNFNMFVEGRTIALHVGNNESLTDSVQHLMGEPFAGTRAFGKWHDVDEGAGYAVNFPKFKDIWQEQHIQFNDVRAENDTIRSVAEPIIRVSFNALMPYSAGCAGSSRNSRETIGDEVRITYLTRTANTEVLSFAEECVFNREWTEVSIVAQRIVPGTIYKILLNDQQVATVAS